MSFLICVLTIWVCIKTVSYGIFEIKTNHNKIGGISVIILGLISVILPNLMLYIK